MPRKSAGPKNRERIFTSEELRRVGGGVDDESVFAAPAFAQEQSVMIENSGANVALQLLNIGGD